MPIGITTEIFKKSYWNYFLELEEEFLLTQKYVTFDKLNFNTFSAEYIKLIQAVCSEIDVVAKLHHILTRVLKMRRIRIYSDGDSSFKAVCQRFVRIALCLAMRS